MRPQGGAGGPGLSRGHQGRDGAAGGAGPVGMSGQQEQSHPEAECCRVPGTVVAGGSRSWLHGNSQRKLQFRNDFLDVEPPEAARCLLTAVGPWAMGHATPLPGSSVQAPLSFPRVAAAEPWQAWPCRSPVCPWGCSFPECRAGANAALRPGAGLRGAPFRRVGLPQSVLWWHRAE